MVSKSWTENDTDFLRKNYESMPVSEIAKALGFHEGTIRHKASEFGISKRKLWSGSDNEFLKENYNKMSYKEIAKRLGFSAETVRCKASELGLKKEVRWRNGKSIGKWANEEIEFLKKNYSDKSTFDMADRLGRSPRAIHSKARELGVKKDRWWSEEEEKFIKKNYGKMSNEELAEHLRRTETSIEYKISRLGLPRSKRGGSVYFYKSAPHPTPGPFKPELVYLVGVLLGDGSVTKTKRSDGRVEQYLWLASIDREFTEYFKKCLLSTVKSGEKVMKVLRREYEAPRKDEWCLSPYINKDWYEFFEWAVSNPKQFVSKLDDESLNFYIRGFFDSEANVNIIGEARRYVQIHAYNTDKSLCKLFESILKDLGYHPKIYVKRGKVFTYRIALEKISDLIKYNMEIGFTISRKSSKLANAISKFEEKERYYREKYERMKKLREKNLSYRKIEKRLGISRHILSQWNDKELSHLSIPKFYEQVKYLSDPG